MNTDDPRPADFAAVVDVRYDFGDDRDGAAHHGLDADEADELAEILLHGHEFLVDADQRPSERVTQTVNSFIRSLHVARSHALDEQEVDDGD